MNETLRRNRPQAQEHARVKAVVPGSGTTADPEAGLPGFVPVWLDRGRRWAGIFAAYFTTQSAAQIAGIVAGLLLINFLPVREYALYTLAMSVVAFFTLVTDLGATSSLLYFSRETRQEGEQFEPFVAAVLSLRRLVFAVGAVAVLVGFPLVAAQRGFSPALALLIGVVIVLAVGFQITGSVRVLVLRLGDEYGRSYRAEVVSGLVRLGAVAVMITASLLYAWVGILGNALAAGALALVAGSVMAAPLSASQLAHYRRRVIRYLLPTLPSALYFSIQGPLVVWLAAMFGGSRNIAEVGALGRLGLIVGLFSGLSGVVFLPRLASITDDRLYRRRYLQFAGALVAIGVTLYSVAVMAPQLFLMILGKNYSGLDAELRLIVLTAVLTLLGGFTVSVNLARSWTKMQTLTVAVYALFQLAAMFFVSLHTTYGVLMFGLICQLVGLGLQLFVALLGFRGCRAVVWAPT